MVLPIYPVKVEDGLIWIFVEEDKKEGDVGGDECRGR